VAEVWERARLIADGYLQVSVELERYDGPRAGLVDIDGAPLYFQCPDWTADEFLVWPTPVEAVPLEREQWEIFVEWNRRRETGPHSAGPHPAEAGNPRYAELGTLLRPYREAPGDARRLLAEWRFDNGERYRADGTDSWVQWTLKAMPFG
jgi:hypothetical protein